LTWKVEILKVDTYAGNDLLDFVGSGRFDYLARRPPSFVTIEGITVVS
jgi:hypothetical protein